MATLICGHASTNTVTIRSPSGDQTITVCQNCWTRIYEPARWTKVG